MPITINTTPKEVTMRSELEDLVKVETNEFHADPRDVYARLRREAPVFWSEPTKCWLITKYDDVRAVETGWPTFSSGGGMVFRDLMRGAFERHPGGAPSIMTLDPPVHGNLRRLISRAFTPKTVAALEPFVRSLTSEILDGLDPLHPVDLCSSLSVPVPMYLIAELLGIPRDRWSNFKNWSDAVIASNSATPEELPALQRQRSEMGEYFAEVIEERRRRPGTDLISGLVAAEIDGERLDTPTVQSLCGTLLVAGNETTRNLISGGLVALDDHPDQRRLLLDQPALIDGAVDEILRWVTPVVHYVRMATCDTENRGTKIAAGEHVALLYKSANFDEDVFEDPDSFDVTRRFPPMHVAFGWGPHLCLGANLARLETRVVFEELLSRYPHYQLAGEVGRAPTSLIQGITSLPVQLA